MTLHPAHPRSPDRVPVFDPEDCNFRLVPLSSLDPSQYAILAIPTLHPRFDIHASNELDTDDSYAVVSRAEHARATRSFIVRLHFYRLGWWRAGVLRLLGSRYRRLWIGPIPAGCLDAVG